MNACAPRQKIINTKKSNHIQYGSHNSVNALFKS